MAQPALLYAALNSCGLRQHICNFKNQLDFLGSPLLVRRFHESQKRRPDATLSYRRLQGRYNINLDRCHIDLSRYNIDLGRYNIDLDRYCIDLGRYSIDLGRYSIDLGRYNIDLGRYSIDLGRQGIDLGRYSFDLMQIEQSKSRSIQ